MVHASCLPNIKDKAVYYTERLIFDSGTYNIGGYTSVEQSADQKLVAKTKDKPDWIIAIGMIMVVMNAAGDVQTFGSWEEYMSGSPGLNQTAQSLIGNSIAFDTTQGADFTII